MIRRSVLPFLFLLPAMLSAQEQSINALLSDSMMFHASVSICILDCSDGRVIAEKDPDKSLVPASVMKMVTSATALEMLGPDYTFKTMLGYSGKINTSKGILEGDIIIKGGGDPALGSEYFQDHYGDFISDWVEAIKSLGIRRITGKIISDDSYYDYQPVPSRWLWEDVGNYYGAGAYGLSVFDNTLKIHLKTGLEGSIPLITKMTPGEVYPDLTNRLVSYGITDSGYVFAAPYGSSGWIEGSVPAGNDDFVLKASISDPPLLLAEIISARLKLAGITVKEGSTTCRLGGEKRSAEPVVILLTTSPPLSDIIRVLNHESVNLFAEHLVKELGKVYENKGSTASGIKTINRFLADSAGIRSGGIILTDGSGLSPSDVIDSRDLSMLLLYMKNHGKYYGEFYSSLPEAGKAGTLKNRFKDPVFSSSLRAKSGSMTRVRSYSGYLTCRSGKEVVFSIIINNYDGPPAKIVNAIENILKETAVQN